MAWHKNMLTGGRRWFRFSLRTLLVLTAMVACWLGYEMNWVRQRREVIGDPGVQYWRYYLGVTSYGNPRRNQIRQIYSIAPWPLNWFGEPGYWGVLLQKGTPDDELARVRRLFPEAEQVAVEDRPETYGVLGTD